LASTSTVFSSTLGVSLDPANLVYGTVIAEANVLKATFSRGMLLVPVGNSSFAFDILFGISASAIGAERSLLEEATHFSRSPGFLANKARKGFTWLNNWLATPSSDSESLMDSIEVLRKSLRIDQRSTETLRALSQHIRAVDFAGAAAIAIAGVLSSIASILVALNVISPLDAPLTVAAIAAGAFSGGVITWLISK